jgi:DNA-directed RNA polymerase subunit RPC12/RpoP
VNQKLHAWYCSSKSLFFSSASFFIGCSSLFPGVPQNQAFLEQFTERLTHGYACKLCRKEFKQKHHAQNHVESLHFPDTFLYTCSHCGRTFNGRNKYYVHVSTYHKFEK